MALSSENGGKGSALQRELDMLLGLLQPSKAHPNALIQANRSITFASMLTEDLEENDEEAPDEKVVDWLRDTLEGDGVHSRGASLREESVDGGKVATSGASSGAAADAATAAARSRLPPRRLCGCFRTTWTLPGRRAARRCAHDR